MKRESLVSDIPAEAGNIEKLFCTVLVGNQKLSPAPPFPANMRAEITAPLPPLPHSFISGKEPYLHKEKVFRFHLKAYFFLLPYSRIVSLFKIRSLNFSVFLIAGP